MKNKEKNKTDTSIQNIKVANIQKKQKVIVDNFPNEQSVSIVNFPKKDGWDKLSIFITFISVCFAFVSTFLYINEL
ncbi:MAG: hypothetical protein KAS62_06310, partial [Candidatus Delongbacteria bacterium]|nr:hypothetical protein [Candidatus Delongbacteria bacterium]